MSIATAIPAARDRQEPLELYRDDGPLARAAGAALGGAVGLPPVLLVLAGAIPLLIVLATSGDDASKPAVGAVVAWLILTAGISSGRPHSDRLRWSVPPALRLAEYTGVLWLAALSGSSALPAAFALLAAVAFHHYELAYRLRYQGVPPPQWVGDLGGGWEGRLVLGYGLLVAEAVPAGFFAIAGLLTLVFVGESIVGWAGFRRAQGLVAYEDEEDQEE